jgi:signal transduction histidine kinase
VLLRVENNGIGIAHAELKRIFKRFIAYTTALPIT